MTFNLSDELWMALNIISNGYELLLHLLLLHPALLLRLLQPVNPFQEVPLTLRYRLSLIISVLSI